MKKLLAVLAGVATGTMEAKGIVMKAWLLCVVCCLLLRFDAGAAPIVHEVFAGCQVDWHWVPDNTMAHATLVDFFGNQVQPAWDGNRCRIVSDNGALCYRIGAVGNGAVLNHVIAGTNGAAAYLGQTDYRVALRFRPLSAISENELIVRFQDNANKYVIHIGAFSGWGHDYENALLYKVVNNSETLLYSPFPQRTIPGIVSNVEYEATAVVVGNRIQFALKRTDGIDNVDGWAIDYTDNQSPILQGGFGFGAYSEGADFNSFIVTPGGAPYIFSGTTVIFY